MYTAQQTAERIKSRAKEKNVLIKSMLEDCELSKNALSSMLSRGSWLQANNLAKIADYLSCSVDYLLGRTDVPDVNTGKSLIDQEVDAYRADLELEARLASSVSSTPDVKEA